MDNKLAKNQCPWCKRLLSFYKFKESSRYIHFSCSACDYKRKYKNENTDLPIPKIEDTKVRHIAKYRVRNVFLAKEFKDKPAIGVDINALREDGEFQVEVRNMPGKVYFQDINFLRVYKSHKWKNKFGKTLKIFPLEIFKERSKEKEPQLSIF